MVERYKLVYLVKIPVYFTLLNCSYSASQSEESLVPVCIFYSKLKITKDRVSVVRAILGSFPLKQSVDGTTCYYQQLFRVH